ncbi:MAG: efflux RND transporter periplasmic adaptor subunit [Gammaproteobacteria bacterium]|nr:efflux RND transporter periplasmic adaptor subunit [Gammaproteobacteria bacterium]
MNETDKNSGVRGSSLRKYAVAVVPVLFLLFGLAGYQWVMTEEKAGQSHKGKPSAVRTSNQKGPWGPRYGRSAPPKNSAGRLKRPVVAARTIRLDTYRPQWKLYGQVIARDRVAMHIPVPGRLTHVGPKLRVGARLKQGDLLAVVDEFPYRSALEEAQATLLEVHAKQKEIGAQITLEQRGLKQSQRQLKLARDELEYMQKLLKQGNVSKKMLDDAVLLISQREQAVQQRESNIEISTARLQQQDAVEKRQSWVVQKAQRALKDARLIAPFDGYVLAANAESGQYITASNKLATVVSDGHLEVQFTMSVDQYGDLLAAGGSVTGLPVQVTWRSGQTHLTFAGMVTRVSPEVAGGSGSITLFAGFDDKTVTTGKLPIGSFVDVVLSGQSVERVARVPESAVYDQNHLFLIEDGGLVARQVQPLAWENGEVLIANGLDEGERILANHLPNAKPGMQVQVKQR